jgi:hypothetical protein
MALALNDVHGLSTTYFMTFGDLRVDPFFDAILVVGGFMTHFFSWRVTPMLHGGALTLGMDMVMLWRHISRIYGHYLSIFLEHFVKSVPFMRVLFM